MSAVLKPLPGQRRPRGYWTSGEGSKLLRNAARSYNFNAPRVAAFLGIGIAHATAMLDGLKKSRASVSAPPDAPMKRCLNPICVGAAIEHAKLIGDIAEAERRWPAAIAATLAVVEYRNGYPVPCLQPNNHCSVE